MIQTLDTVIRVLFAIPFLVVLALPFFFRKRKALWRVGLGLFAIPIVLVFALWQILASLIYHRVMQVVNDVKAPCQVLVNDLEQSEPERIIAALRRMNNSLFQAHHSHPTMRIRVALTCAGKPLNLELGRDSERAHEYWVFSPEYRSTDQNEIARITTDVFDRY